jgi:acetoin utilization deacetylase AcuC-like enzyme
MPDMTLRMPFVWSPACLEHVPAGEVWVGVTIAGSELPERATVIRRALAQAGAPEVAGAPHDDAMLRAVHDEDMLHFLEHGLAEWVAAGFPEDPGQDRVVPYVFPTAALLDGLPLRLPAAVHGRAGTFAYDTMTLVGPGTWAAARGAVDAALTAADLVGSGAHRNAYALCRPPGHHATRSGYGGSCYLNNAGVAAEALLGAGHARVAVIDIDAHHGNGTQMLFYDRADVYYGSVHIDPGAGWFPHYLGHGEERGRGPGWGANRNVPLEPETSDAAWLAGLSRVVDDVRTFEPGAVVLSLGVDAAADDPESPLRVTTDGYYGAGELVGSLGVPVVAVQEGGYHLPSLGALVVATLEGLESGGDGR